MKILCKLLLFTLILNLNLYSKSTLFEECYKNSDCLNGYYCDKSGSAACFGKGKCKLKPNYCENDIRYVCGCNLKTYLNKCQASIFGVNILHEGRCHKNSKDILKSESIKNKDNANISTTTDNTTIDNTTLSIEDTEATYKECRKNILDGDFSKCWPIDNESNYLIPDWLKSLISNTFLAAAVKYNPSTYTISIPLFYTNTKLHNKFNIDNIQKVSNFLENSILTKDTSIFSNQLILEIFPSIDGTSLLTNLIYLRDNDSLIRYESVLDAILEKPTTSDNITIDWPFKKIISLNKVLKYSFNEDNNAIGLLDVTKEVYFSRVSLVQIIKISGIYAKYLDKDEITINSDDKNIVYDSIKKHLDNNNETSYILFLRYAGEFNQNKEVTINIRIKERNFKCTAHILNL